MPGKTNSEELITEMNPILNMGEYVFVSIKDTTTIHFSEVLGSFNEEEGTTVILEKNKADELNLPYDFIASWITLKVHSALEAVGLTATFSKALAKNNISCNVVAGYYHDHIFIAKKDTQKAMETLQRLADKEK